ncbi:TIGR00153 family protein [Hippea alviniae]|uniref:TIGR00153 family protein n=1 Tax=Hippea alviniae TaxID=1279027 RepID=UPI0003B69FA9|nr:TIGR00153 family protein [Hippea alviniae]
MGIFDLFRKSPFIAIGEMMREVMECTNRIPSLYDAFVNGDYEKVQQTAKEISDHEYRTDEIKNSIRQSLPNSIFMPVARGDLLQIITSMDAIADRTEDLGVLMTFKKIAVPEELKKKIDDFVKVVLKVVELSKSVIDELETLREASFTGPEARHIVELLDKINESEHESDVFQYDLTKIVLNTEGLDCASLMLWMKIIETTGDIANAAEKMANRIRLIISQ